MIGKNLKNLKKILKMKKNLELDLSILSKNKLRSLSILCIGDLMLDRFIYGKVDRLSPEAPIPIFLPNRERFSLGGVGNVAKNLSDVGAKCSLLSIVGTDQISNKIKSLVLKERNITSEIISYKDYVSPLKTRYVKNSKHLLRVDKEKKSFKKNSKLKLKITDCLIKNIKKCNLIILSDYNKGFLDKHLIKEVIKLGKKYNKTIIADPKKLDFAYYSGVDVLTPNQKEISDAAKINLNSEKDIISYARKIINNFKIKEILVTRSNKGMLLIGANYIKKIQATSKNVIDVTGAGDTVISIFSLMKALGISSKDSSRIANAAAGISIEKSGTATLKYKELISII
tara:strand:+ start:906 stop:1931 length:1026 start_codon:yes stop_codon:yes gene_type:complete